MEIYDGDFDDDTEPTADEEAELEHEAQLASIDPEVANPEGVAEQSRVRELVASGKSVFLTGKAGTGKSHVTKQIIAEARAAGKQVLVCGSTGRAAQMLGGYTVHRALGLWPDVDPDSDYERLVNVSSEMTTQLQAVDLLVVDEISMIRADLFEAMDLRFRAARSESTRIEGFSDAPFGGVTVLLVGDLLQLPPVVAFDEYADTLEFYRRWGGLTFRDSRKYSELVGHGFTEQALIHAWRQRDQTMVGMLDQVRYGQVDAELFEELGKYVLSDGRIKSSTTVDTKIDLAVERAVAGWTVLAASKANVYKTNDKVLAQVCRPQDIHEFEVFTQGSITTSEITSFGFRVDDGNRPLKQRFGIGARVMFNRNDPQGRWVNGSMGYVRDFTSGPAGILSGSERFNLLRVELDGGGVVVVPKQEFLIEEPVAIEIPDDNEVGGTRTVLSSKQVGAVTGFPVQLSWAITVHKSQGQSLEKCYLLNPQTMSDEGQMYVAMSRATGPQGLVLDSLPETWQLQADRSRVRRDKAVGLQGAGGRVEQVTRLAFMSLSGPEHTNRKRVGSICVTVVDSQTGDRLASFSTWINPECLVFVDGDEKWGPSVGLTAKQMPLAMAPTLGEAWPVIMRQIHGAVIVADDLTRLEQALTGKRSQAGQGIYELGAGVDVAELQADGTVPGFTSGEDEPWCRVLELIELWQAGALDQALSHTQDVLALPLDEQGALPKEHSRGTALLATGMLVYPNGLRMVLDSSDASRATASDVAWSRLTGPVVNQIGPVGEGNLIPGEAVPADAATDEVPGLLTQLLVRVGSRTGWGPDNEALWRRMAANAGVDRVVADNLIAKVAPRGPAGPEALRRGQVILLRGLKTKPFVTKLARRGLIIYSESLHPNRKGFDPKAVDVVLTKDPSAMDHKSAGVREKGGVMVAPATFWKWYAAEEGALRKEHPVESNLSWFSG